ncbi:MAG: hypothetical protein JWQ87_70 [Candidatus Sulfotelmatobacter sp.]|nr:hypothetical protein [Candidatus Sulfotelmatobacter sp.]
MTFVFHDMIPLSLHCNERVGLSISATLGLYDRPPKGAGSSGDKPSKGSLITGSNVFGGLTLVSGAGDPECRKLAPICDRDR